MSPDARPVTGRSLRRSWYVLPWVIVAGCAVGPDFKTPAAPAVDRYSAAPVPVQTAATTAPVHGGEAQILLAGQPVPQQWWQLFGSEKLNALVDEAFAASPSVTSARSALTRAEELLNAQRGYQLPTVDAGFGAQRQKSFMNFGEPSVIGPLSLYNADVSVAYGVDVFGGLRRRVEGQASLVEYQRYELQATYLTLAANVVTTSVQEASLRAQIQATQEIVASQEDLLNLSEVQFKLGAIAYPQLLAARSELAAVRASLPQLQRSLHETQSQLAVYLGKLPVQHVNSNFALEELTLPQQIPLGVASELVRRRPDVRAAEALLHKASADVGVATADMYPQFTIGASYGASSNELSTLFDNTVFNLGANIAQPIFHGGTLNAQRRAAKAAYEGAVADYRQTVLSAFKNTSDALQAVLADAESLRALHDALLSADNSLQLIDQQYRLGGASYLELLIAQRQARQAKINYLQRLASRYQNTAALLLAIGGEWTDPATSAQRNESQE